MSFWSFENDPTETQDFITSNPLCPQKIISTTVQAAMAEHNFGKIHSVPLGSYLIKHNVQHANLHRKYSKEILSTSSSNKAEQQ